MASFLIPREFIPKLTMEMKKRLAVANVGESNQSENDEDLHPSRTKVENSASGNGLMTAESFRPVTD